MNDFWPDFSVQVPCEKNNAVLILREQARLLERKTNKCVKATFSKIEYGDTALRSSLTTFGKALASMSLPSEEILENELSNKIDANTLYTPVKYKFEIYNSKYHFRVFELINSSEFPISLKIDEGISNELNIETKVEIHSNAELENIVKSIFSSQKLKTIISRMMNDVTEK